MLLRQLAALCALLGSVVAWTACARGQVLATPLVRAIRLPVLSKPSLPHEAFTYETKDGLTLRGWLIHPTTTGGAPRRLLVYLHGKDNNRSLATTIAPRFVGHGYAVMAYDQRAHGASDGEYTTYGAREAEDLRGILDAAGFEEVVLVGESLGAAVALQTASQDRRIKAVVAAASFSDLEIIMRERGGVFAKDEDVVAEVVASVRRTAGFDLTQISPRTAAADIHVPVLLVHGMRDAFTTPDHSARIFEALPEGTPKRLVHVQGAGHADILRHDEVWQTIEQWMTSLPR